MTPTLYAGCGVKPLEPGAVGIDYNGEYLRRNRQLSPGALLVQGDLLHIPFPDNTFNEIECWEVLEHIYDKEATVRELHRVCREGGTLRLSTPMRHVEEFLARISRNYRTSVLETQHQWVVSREETISTVGKYFEIGRVSYVPDAYLLAALMALQMDGAGATYNDAGELVGNRAPQVLQRSQAISRWLRKIVRVLARLRPQSFSKSIILECRKSAHGAIHDVDAPGQAPAGATAATSREH